MRLHYFTIYLQLSMTVSSNEITLVFSQGISVKLNVSQLNIFIRDLNEPYPTKQIPDHFVESSEV